MYDENSFEREAESQGALYVGSPETVANKIIETVEALGITRFMLHTPVDLFLMKEQSIRLNYWLNV